MLALLIWDRDCSLVWRTIIVKILIFRFLLRLVLLGNMRNLCGGVWQWGLLLAAVGARVYLFDYLIN